MDPYELEFKDRPRTLRNKLHGRACRPTAPREKGRVMLEVKKYLSRLSGYWKEDVVLAGIAHAIGADARDVDACLTSLRSAGMVEFHQADKGSSYCVRGRRVAWNGSSWVLDVEDLHPSGPFSFASRKKSSKVVNRKRKKAKERNHDRRVRALAKARPVSWDGIVLSVSEGLLEKPMMTAEAVPVPACAVCGADGCNGGRRGRLLERRRQLKACRDRVVSQVLET